MNDLVMEAAVTVVMMKQQTKARNRGKWLKTLLTVGGRGRNRLS